MAMDERKSAVVENKDILIERANKLLKRKGLDYLFHTFRLARGEITDCIKKALIMNDFTSKDQIVLHFNRFQDANKMQQFTDHVATHKFPTKTVAKAFIEATIREAWERVPEPSKKWVSADRLALNDWIIITANGPHTLERIMEAKVDKQYKLPAPYDYYAEQIMAYHWGLHPQVNSRTRGSALPEADYEKLKPPSRIRESNERQSREKRADKYKARRTSALKPNEASRLKQAKTPKSTDGVSLAQICTSLKIDPKEARAALRKTNYPKPGAGWEWDKSQADKISRDVKAAVEKARKK